MLVGKQPIQSTFVGLGEHFFHLSTVFRQFFKLLKTKEEIVDLSNGSTTATGDALTTASIVAMSSPADTPNATGSLVAISATALR